MGKRKPKKGQTKKPRAVEVQVEFDSAGAGRVQFWADGSMRFVDMDGMPLTPSRAQVSSVYRRDSGKSDKVLTRTPAVPSAIHLDGNKLLAGAGSVFAVDTNTREIRGVKRSVCVSLMITDVAMSSSAWQARPSAMAALEFLDAHASPEHTGWNYAIQLIELMPVPQPVTLIVDSDLDALPAINRRERPYFMNQMLPPGFTLVYASSDAGTTEFIANKAIAGCDTMASQILRQIEADPDSDEKYYIGAGPNRPFGKWREWKFGSQPVP